MDAWSLFDEAAAAPRETRRERLEAVLAALDADPIATASDRAELKAAVLCQLAGVGGSSIESAVGAVDAAAAHGRTGWPNYYLAVAAIQMGANELALRHLESIPEGFFDQRGLVWRTVHTWELAAIARLELGDLPSARRLVHRIAGALATRGEADDLAPPRDLVRRLLLTVETGRDEGRELLDVIATSVEVSAWFDDRLAARIREAIEMV